MGFCRKGFIFFFELFDGWKMLRGKFFDGILDLEEVSGRDLVVGVAFFE